MAAQAVGRGINKSTSSLPSGEREDVKTTQPGAVPINAEETAFSLIPGALK